MQVVLATAGYDHTIRLWDVVNGCVVACMQHPEGHINSIAVSPDKRWLATAGHLSIRVYDLHNEHQLGVAWGAAFAQEAGTGHEGNVMAIGWLNERLLWSVGEDGTIRVNHFNEGFVGQTLIRGSCPFTAAALLESDCLVVTDEQGGVGLWNLTTGQCTLEMVLPSLTL